MNKLPIEFEKNTFKYKQLKRTKDVAIYLQIKHGRVCAYEVVKIRSRDDSISIINGRECIFEAGEYYPRNSDWGKYAWTELTLKDAEKKFQELNEVSQ